MIKLLNILKEIRIIPETPILKVTIDEWGDYWNEELGVTLEKHHSHFYIINLHSVVQDRVTTELREKGIPYGDGYKAIRIDPKYIEIISRRNDLGEIRVIPDENKLPVTRYDNDEYEYDNGEQIYGFRDNGKEIYTQTFKHGKLIPILKDLGIPYTTTEYDNSNHLVYLMINKKYIEIT